MSDFPFLRFPWEKPTPPPKAIYCRTCKQRMVVSGSFQCNGTGCDIVEDPPHDHT